MIHHGSMIQIGHPQCHVVHQLPDPRHVGIIDVLRLVGDLVVVAVQTGGEEDDGNPPPRVVVAPCFSSKLYAFLTATIT